jgi:hypothetical protein
VASRSFGTAARLPEAKGGDTLLLVFTDSGLDTCLGIGLGGALGTLLPPFFRFVVLVT